MPYFKGPCNIKTMGFLFDEIIFGPVHSRRLGSSLGINLLPANYKFCTFNCVYCECGWTHKADSSKIKLPARKDVYARLERKLADLLETGHHPDAITFAGNGEPTIHPEFGKIIDDTIKLRDTYFPHAKVTVLSNASTLGKPEIVSALTKIDKNILKLDAGTEETFRLINHPRPGLKLSDIVKKLKSFNGTLIIQTLFVRGEYKGNRIDNTTAAELDAWLANLKEIKPAYVMIYPVDRQTAAEGLERISIDELSEISEKVEACGIKTQVYS